MSGDFQEILVETGNISQLQDVDTHLMPCTIDHNGPAKVSDFFKPTIIENSEGLSASFRGRPIEGRKIVLPSGYVGVVLNEDRNRSSQENRLNVTNKFYEFTYWNLDCAPSSNDKIIQALKWIDISKALHSSVNETDQSQRSNASI